MPGSKTDVTKDFLKSNIPANPNLPSNPIARYSYLISDLQLVGLIEHTRGLLLAKNGQYTLVRLLRQRELSGRKGQQGGGDKGEEKVDKRGRKNDGEEERAVKIQTSQVRDHRRALIATMMSTT